MPKVHDLYDAILKRGPPVDRADEGHPWIPHRPPVVGIRSGVGRGNAPPLPAEVLVEALAPGGVAGPGLDSPAPEGLAKGVGGEKTMHKRVWQMAGLALIIAYLVAFLALPKLETRVVLSVAVVVGMWALVQASRLSK
ncbi:MAG: hypothetical protein Q8O40_06620 [Chloroflexota bacterium]|nr:hypothetical protein [Chloroflexota bacterium]